jgi:predicted transcriptional regulator
MIDKSKLELIGEIAQANNKNLELIQEINQLQSNWNSLREWLKNKIDNFQDDVSEPILHEQMTMRVIYEYMENLDKMNELESSDNK